ncbi:hypothetical protein CKO28_08855 [Rhodovibrio sodomensis]|uniref:Uncharacterized protein n=1 Tax=Rhodovibrio sodomensis TaxID=1088 RepID=A0ABS1DD52_9PROT|nr:hypothetical protein [Rhodovibrio sodomensis]MBK1668144.1 hypothetical protein [Rhodovibrio sodomensis]
MIRRVTRRSHRRQPELRTGAALERRIDLWPFLLAAALTAGAMTAVELRLDAAAPSHAVTDRQPAASPQLSERLSSERR